MPQKEFPLKAHHSYKIVILAIACLIGICNASASDAAYRSVTLDNGLRAILISNPDAWLSAASITVGVGTLCNPTNKQGLAHFVEHLLFQGSRKYPRPGEFQNFIIRNSGYYYANTDLDCTNYGFQIRNGAFEEALDRFADFFTAPLMDKKTIPAELKIIEDEFHKFSTSDSYTIAAVKARFFKEGHPMKNMLPGGNAKTLKKVTQKDAKAFFDTYYRPERITLAVQGNQGLDELESTVRRLFSPLKRGKSVTIPDYKDFIDEKNTLSIVRIATKGNYKLLNLDFALESKKDDWKGRPQYLVRMQLESTAPGSLLALLKQEGLATGLTVATARNAKATTQTGWFISIILTDKGVSEYRRVLELFFSEINLLRTSEFPLNLYKKKQVSSVDDANLARRLSGMQLTMHVAPGIHAYPLDQVVDLNFIQVMEINETAYYNVLDQIRPSRMIASLVTSDLKEGMKEPHYGTLYTCTKESDDFYKKLLAPEKHKSLYISEVIPEEELSENKTSIENYTESAVPVNLVQETDRSLFFIRSNVFGNNRISIRVRMSLPEDCVSLKEAAKLAILADIAREVMPAWIGQETALSGVEFTVDFMPHRLIFEITGQGGKVHKVAELLARLLRSPDTSATFDWVKNRLGTYYGSYQQQDPYITALDYYTAIAFNYCWRYQDFVSPIESTAGKDMAVFAKTICSKSKLDAMIYGDLDEIKARQIFDDLSVTFGHDASSSEGFAESKSIKLSQGENVVFWEQHASPNSGIRLAYHDVSGSDPESMVAAKILGQYIGGAFHVKMCVEEKIAYVAMAYTYDGGDRSLVFFEIQSSQLAADKLLSATDSFLEQIPDMFAHISDDHWRDLVAGVREEISRKPLSIAEAVNRYFDLAFERNGNWEWPASLLKAVDRIQKQDVHKLLKETFDKQTRKRIVVVEYGNNQTPSGSKASPYNLKELEKWKVGRVYE